MVNDMQGTETAATALKVLCIYLMVPYDFLKGVILSQIEFAYVGKIDAIDEN